MNIKKEMESLRNQLHKAYINAGTLQSIASNTAGLVFSEELHKLTANLETLTLQARNLDESCYMCGGEIVKKPYNKHWNADFAGKAGVDENG